MEDAPEGTETAVVLAAFPMVLTASTASRVVAATQSYYRACLAAAARAEELHTTTTGVGCLATPRSKTSGG
jgi:hypothetical protein